MGKIKIDSSLQQLSDGASNLLVQEFGGALQPEFKKLKDNLVNSVEGKLTDAISEMEDLKASLTEKSESLVGSIQLSSENIISLNELLLSTKETIIEYLTDLQEKLVIILDANTENTSSKKAIEKDLKELTNLVEQDLKSIHQKVEILHSELNTISNTIATHTARTENFIGSAGKNLNVEIPKFLRWLAIGLGATVILNIITLIWIISR